MHQRLHCVITVQCWLKNVGCIASQAETKSRILGQVPKFHRLVATWKPIRSPCRGLPLNFFHVDRPEVLEKALARFYRAGILNLQTSKASRTVQKDTAWLLRLNFAAVWPFEPATSPNAFLIDHFFDLDQYGENLPPLQPPICNIKCLQTPKFRGSCRSEPLRTGTGFQHPRVLSSQSSTASDFTALQKLESLQVACCGRCFDSRLNTAAREGKISSVIRQFCTTQNK